VQIFQSTNTVSALNRRYC